MRPSDRPYGDGHAEARRQLISVVVPAYNEADVLGAFARRTTAVLEALPYDYEFVFVNDGSTDDTLAIMHDLHRTNPHVAIIDLSRNFGKEIALSAGIDHAGGDAVVVIDADLQDPPELITALVAEWQKGFDVVYAQRRSRDGESWLKRTTATLFYRIMQQVGPVRIPVDTGDFRLMSRKAVTGLRQLREKHRFMKGLFAWVGYRCKAVPYDRAARHAGRTKWSYWKLWNLSVEGITSFTTLPLTLSIYVGLLIALFAFAFGAWIVVRTLLYGDPVRGFPALMTTLLFLGGAQLMALGILGEYVGRIFNEAKQRPLYLVQDVFQPRTRLAPAPGEAPDPRQVISTLPPGGE